MIIYNVRTYKEAKEILLTLLKISRRVVNGYSIILLGRGGIGKSYLINDVKEKIISSGFTYLHECPFEKVNKAVIATNNIEAAERLNYLHIIDMNAIKII